MMKQDPEPIMVDVITRVSQPMQYGDIFKCADGDIFMMDTVSGVHRTAVVLVTGDNDLGRNEGEQYALLPGTVKPPYTLIISLSEHFDD